MFGFPSDLVHRTLENGLSFIARSVPGLPITSTMIWYRVGSGDEKAGCSGISHFLEHMMFKGTPSLPRGMIDRITQRYGGVNNAFTWLDYTAYYFNFSSDRWKVALGIEGDRIRNSLLERREFELEKRVVLEERSIEMDSPEGLLMEEVNRLAFSVHPYGQPVVGWMEDLERLTPEEMWAFYRGHYVPNNALIVMVGDFDVDRAYVEVERQFGDLEPVSLVGRGIAEPPQRAERRVVLERDCQLPRLTMAFHVPEAAHQEAPALLLLDILLTSGRTSRLHKRLVDKEKLVSWVETSYFETMDPYLFSVATELHRGSNLERVEQVILQELDRLAEKGPTLGELERCKKLFEADWILEHQTAEAQATEIGEAWSCGGISRLERLPSLIAGISPGEIQGVVRRYFRPLNRTVGHLVPVSQNPGVIFWGRGKRGLSGSSGAAVSGPVLQPVPSRRKWRPQGLSRTIQRFEVSCESFALRNGLKVLCLPRHLVPGVYAELMVPTGSRYEGEKESGLSFLLGKMLLEGTERRTAVQLASEAESMGADLISFGGYMMSRIAVETLSRDLGQGLDLMADIARNSIFPEEKLQDRLREQLSLISSIEEEPRQIGRRLFNELVFPRHPARRPLVGYRRTVSGLTRRQLMREYEASFHPGEAVLALAGDFEISCVRELVERVFGDWKAQESSGKRQPPRSPRLQRAVRSKFLHREKEQLHLYVGHLGIRRTNPDYPAVVVMDNILGVGAGFTDRLSQRLRDREGLAYTVHASLSRSAGIDPGVFLAYIGTSPEKGAQALKGIRQEVERIQREPVFKSEIRRVLSYLRNQSPFMFQTNRALAAYALTCQQYGWGFDEHGRFLESLAKVGTDDVQRVAQKYLHPDHFTMVGVGPVTSSTGNLEELLSHGAVRSPRRSNAASS